MVSNGGGRRNDPAISQALFQAAERWMETDGFASLTVDGLVTEVGTSRPAFYRRYRSIGELAFQVITDRFGDNEPPASRALEADLLHMQRNEVAMMTSALMRQNLPSLLELIRQEEELRQLYLDRFILPRRSSVARVVSTARDRGEPVRDDVDLDYVCDLLIGPLLARLLLPTGLPVDDSLARRTVRSALDEIRP